MHLWRLVNDSVLFSKHLHERGGLSFLAGFAAGRQLQELSSYTAEADETLYVCRRHTSISDCRD